ncbi:MAG: family 10 glycosylhydrolase [Clostridia bacterium]|nr:family 10 glycosylhydrolase [Clostridia bacterium]
MKKAALLLAVLLLAGCAGNAPARKSPEKTEMCGVWISCYELSPMLEGGNFKEAFAAAAKNLKRLGASDAFVHVRAFGESLFKSEFYPQSAAAARYDFDVLEFMIEELSRNGIFFHAWINPFRQKDGTFADPASESERAKILGEIREIVRGYAVRGIHFDDYFYTETTAEGAFYEAYRSEAQNPLGIEDYRTANISWLISAAKSAAKSADRDVLFSVSPAADIAKNKDAAFADVAAWCENGDVDIIMPQLYFGFDYPLESFRFDNLLAGWKKAAGGNVKLVIGLAAYKLGTDTPPDSAEWKEGADILARQTGICFSDDAIDGVCFFSYSYLFSEDDLHKTSLSKIIKYTSP